MSDKNLKYMLHDVQRWHNATDTKKAEKYIIWNAVIKKTKIKIPAEIMII